MPYTHLTMQNTLNDIIVRLDACRTWLPHVVVTANPLGNTQQTNRYLPYGQYQDLSTPLVTSPPTPRPFVFHRKTDQIPEKIQELTRLVEKLVGESNSPTVVSHAAASASEIERTPLIQESHEDKAKRLLLTVYNALLVPTQDNCDAIYNLSKQLPGYGNAWKKVAMVLSLVAGLLLGLIPGLVCAVYHHRQKTWSENSQQGLSLVAKNFLALIENTGIPQELEYDEVHVQKTKENFAAEMGKYGIFSTPPLSSAPAAPTANGDPANTTIAITTV